MLYFISFDTNKSLYAKNDHNLKNKTVIVGIDEAGRGPVLGPMAYAASFWDAKSNYDDIGFSDSKVLTAAQRESLFKVINDSDKNIGWEAILLSPREISAKMLRRYHVFISY